MHFSYQFHNLHFLQYLPQVYKVLFVLEERVRELQDQIAQEATILPIGCSINTEDLNVALRRRTILIFMFM